MTGRLAGFALGSFMLAPVAAADGQQDPPPWSQADEVWGEDSMEAAREQLLEKHGDTRATYFQAERFELQSFDDEDVLLLDGNAWTGGDINKLWLKTELEYLPDEGKLEEAEVQALWSRAISPYWDFQAGLRYDFEPQGQPYLVAGFQGLAPYLFETDAAAFLSDEGDLTARVEAEYELLLSQRLILQPRAEIGFSAQDVPERGIGSGVTGIDAGLRLRYEVKRTFAPYIGVEWQESLGATADMIEAGSGETGQAALIVGIRAWY